MKRVLMCGLAALAAMATTPLQAQDNPEGDWGAIYGGNYGVGRTDTFPLIFEPGDEIEVAWVFDAYAQTNMLGLRRYQQLVFDADSNLYWITGDYWDSNVSKLASLDKDGALRWVYAGPTGDGLGMYETRQTPIVGGDAVYCASNTYEVYDGDPPVLVGHEWYVYAINKTNGSVIWDTLLDNEPSELDGCCWTPNMTLLNGKLYLIGRPHANGVRAIYVIDAATGDILHNQTISGLPSGTQLNGTNLVAVEDVFGEGVAGLYLTCFDDSWSTRFAYGVEVDVANPANTTLAWDDPVGRWAPKHMIYVEEFDILLTYGLDSSIDCTVFALDPVVGDALLLDWADSAGEGDVGPDYQCTALGFYDEGTDTVPVFSGAWGRVNEYAAGDTGVNFSASYGLSVPWGETGPQMQIVLNPENGHEIAVTASTGLPCRLVMLDLDGDMTFEPEGPMYIDDLKIYSGPDSANLTLAWSDDFEGYTPGSIVGQGGWADASEATETPCQVVADPENASNQVLKLDVVAEYVGAAVAATVPDTNVYRLEYRQWISNVSQNIYVSLAEADINTIWDDEATHLWSQNNTGTSRMTPIAYQGYWDGPNVLWEKVWEDIVITHDYVNAQSDITLSSVKQATWAWTESYPDKPDGFAFHMAYNPWDNSNGPNAVLLNYLLYCAGETGDQYGIVGGPLVGPDGKLYFGFLSHTSYGEVEPRAGQILALQPKPDGLCADANCDGAINAFDIDPFVIALVNRTQWEATYSCDYLASCDINGDGAVNAFDIDPFVVALVGGGCQ